SLLAVAVVLGPISPGAHAQDAPAVPEDTWLPTLMTETPQQGFELALTLARRAVVATQPNREVLRAVRPEYASDADSLIAASQVVAVHFQTIAAANDYWRSERSEQAAQ